MSQEKNATTTASEPGAVTPTEGTDEVSPPRKSQTEEKPEEATNVIVEKTERVNEPVEKLDGTNEAVKKSKGKVVGVEKPAGKTRQTETENVRKMKAIEQIKDETKIAEEAAEAINSVDVTPTRKKNAKFIDDASDDQGRQQQERIPLTKKQSAKFIDDFADDQAKRKPENVTLTNQLTLKRKDKTIKVKRESVEEDEDEAGDFTDNIEIETVQDAEFRVDLDQLEKDVKAKLKEIDNDSDSGSDRSMTSIQSELSYLKEEEIVQGPDFLDIFETVPDIEDISSDDEADIARRKKKEEELEREHFGQFSETIDEELFKDEEKESLEEESNLLVTEEEETEEEEILEDIEDDELLAFALQDKDEDEVVVRAQALNLDIAFDEFFALDTEQNLDKMKADEQEAKARLEARRQLAARTEKFLYDLINHVVDLGELQNPNVILRRNLDKMKLMDELDRVITTLQVEQKTCLFLNRKATEFFRRKKSFRAITEDNPETIMRDWEKYKESVAYLDQLLGTEKDTLITITAKLETLKAEEIEMEEISRNEIRDFEELVKKTCGVEAKPKLLVVIASLLERLEESRKEISDVRFILIQKQHKFAVLMEKLDKLEHIGEGLLMTDYDNLHREMLGLDKKNEERANELHKLRNRYNSDWHIKAHMKEKQLMMLNKVTIQREALNDLLDSKQTIREYLYTLKVKRSKIRKDIQEIHFQGGLLYKPELMFDYDNTVERVHAVQARVTQMKKKHTEILNRIQSLERKYDE